VTFHEPDSVLQFWFNGSLSGDPMAMVRQIEWWFRGGADLEINQRFQALLEHATRGELDRWCHEARSRLALIIILDQFSRTIHRGTVQAFAQDPKACALTLEGIKLGHYAALKTPWEKTFFFLPLGHSENLEYQELAVKLADQLVEEATMEHRTLLEFSATQARGHRDVIARFGRHPHRNEVLGRESSPEELEYVASGRLVHTRPIPQRQQ
jgi:uncharacterized protein (DUF924 family)